MCPLSFTLHHITWFPEYYAQTPWFARTATWEIAENTAYTQRFLLSDSGVFRVLGFRVLGFWGFGVLGFRVRRLVNAKTLALRRFLSMSKDNIWTPFLSCGQTIGSCRDISPINPKAIWAVSKTPTGWLRVHNTRTHYIWGIIIRKLGSTC